MKDRLVVQVPAGDGDGDYDTNDKAAIDSIVLNAFSPSGEPISSAAYYDPDADLDRNGIINGTDSTLGGTGWAAALARGVLSSSAVDNATGYDGYRYNAETMQYTVRHRWYDTVLGRWLQRDALGYVDGYNVYAYCASSPFYYSDPSGQDAIEWLVPYLAEAGQWVKAIYDQGPKQVRNRWDYEKSFDLVKIIAKIPGIGRILAPALRGMNMKGKVKIYRDASWKGECSLKFTSGIVIGAEVKGDITGVVAGLHPVAAASTWALSYNIKGTADATWSASQVWHYPNKWSKPENGDVNVGFVLKGSIGFETRDWLKRMGARTWGDAGIGWRKTWTYDAGVVYNPMTYSLTKSTDGFFLFARLGVKWDTWLGTFKDTFEFRAGGEESGFE